MSAQFYRMPKGAYRISWCYRDSQGVSQKGDREATPQEAAAFDKEFRTQVCPHVPTWESVEFGKDTTPEELARQIVREALFPKCQICGSKLRPRWEVLEG